MMKLTETYNEIITEIGGGAYGYFMRNPPPVEVQTMISKVNRLIVTMRKQWEKKNEDEKSSFKFKIKKINNFFNRNQSLKKDSKYSGLSTLASLWGLDQPWSKFDSEFIEILKKYLPQEGQEISNEQYHDMYQELVKLNHKLEGDHILSLIK